MKSAFDKLMSIISFLEDNRIYYRISKVSETNDTIMIDIAIPGERWEIEVFSDGRILIEKFISDGSFFDESALNSLVEKENLE